MNAKSNLLVVTIFLTTEINALSQPIITRQPTNQSVSLGANVSFRVTATSTNLLTPITYQWRREQVYLSAKTNFSLMLTNVQVVDAGGYDVIVTDTSGSVTSLVATLAVDPAFTKITSGPIVTDGGASSSCSWGDYDNDGWLDLFVPNDAGGKNFLYRNNGDGSFARITSGSIVNDLGFSAVGVWGDFDNDGFLDLFVSHFEGQKNSLYGNNGDGTFTRITSGIIVNDLVSANWGSDSCALGDYDNDGFLDLFVTNASPGSSQKNFLYHNNGDGTFTKITNSIAVTAFSNARGCAWGDYDNDGKLDLFVANAFFRTNFLFHKDGDGSFTRVLSGSIVNDSADSRGCVWGDFDNDGYLDLFIANGGRISTQNNFLYRNNGDGTFTKITNGIIVNDGGHSLGCAWGDYDNDGYLDLFVANAGGQKNFLYHNNGDGTFTKVTEGSLANDIGNSGAGCSWGDYDKDGFLDLFVANDSSSGANFLYRNNGNSNTWIKIKCVGTVSNRAAIGAKVRVKATIGGKTVWQLRQVSGGDGYSGGNELYPHFGLGDATNVDTVRIEWPSGTVQEFHDLAVRQFLTLTEPPRLSPGVMTNGTFQLSLKGGRGFEYGIDTSTNLLDWSRINLLSITNLDGTASFTDPDAPNYPLRFYRAAGQ